MFDVEAERGKLAKSFQSDGDSRRKAPSFASFASAKVKAPPESVSTKGS